LGPDCVFLSFREASLGNERAVAVVSGQAYAGKRAGDKKRECVVCYAESDDGLTFSKPDFDLFPFKEHAKTNIVLIGTSGYGDRYCNSVLVDPAEKEPAGGGGIITDRQLLISGI
jgi:hypothetical protein